MKTVYELMAEVACKLSGKPVKLRFQHNEGCYGLCRADSSGLLTIDLEPELQFYEEKFLHVFLHEISHAKFDSFIPLEFEVSDRMPVSNNTGYKLKEIRAEKQASTWLKYAEKNRDIQQPYFEGCLWSLYNSSF
jgi:hypothetical protein